MIQDLNIHYLDNAATTMVAPEVADVIDKAMREHWANPSSLYAPGARSEEALNAARAAVARTFGCKPKELYFTSCGSESNNLALLGAARTRTFGKDIVVDDQIALEWARIPHFYYNYYVFQYATGYSAAIALSRRILKEGAPAVKDYLGFLSGGCSQDPIDLLRGAGVDMASPQPIQAALDLFGQLLDEMEELTRKD